MKSDHIANYLTEVRKIYATGVTTENSFRSTLEFLFNGIRDDVIAINEPKMEKVGRPDFVFKRKIGADQVTVGHCEAKDIDKDVSPKGLRSYSKEQFARYNKGLPNLIYTNGLDFRFYVKGELIGNPITIGHILMGKIEAAPDAFAELAQRLTEFAQERLQTITSAKRLAELMAGKALLVKEALFQSLKLDPDLTTELAGQYRAFKDQLIHDLTPEAFADIYAETIAYGLFAARLHDDTLEDFSRQEALDLLPKSNPFLRNLFSYVAGPNLEDTIRRDIDELAEIFQATDLGKLFKDFGSFTQRNDPFIHFYETFLAEYNPKKRKARGVWYTPEPVVNFIVRAVDDVLKTEFGLPMGLADTSKITVPVDTGQTKVVRGKAKPIIENREMHRVQILDPATGTGTFLAEVIKQIAPKVKDIAPGKWSRYVEQDLIPRLHGFELLMASYAMCHMKLDMMLRDMDYIPTDKPPRLSVYLTNSLEEAEEEEHTLFMARWLSDEANAANHVKRDKPIMCIIGNPPYSGESANKGDWIMGLMEAYKKEPGGKEKLKERNPKWINDDYVKFIRMSEHMIEQNGEGILAFITNHGYLDNPTFRGMRWKLMQTFDKIFVMDLHGNSKKKETSPDGSPDTNVFDIQQGVAIIVAVKKRVGHESKLATTIHKEIWGTRKTKYADLWKRKLVWDLESELPQKAPQYPFVKRNYDLLDSYQTGFAIKNAFPVNGVGMVTARDHFVIGTQNELIKRFEEFSRSPRSETYLHDNFDVPRKKGWDVIDAHDSLQNIDDISDLIKPITYRPFDVRNIVYQDDLVWRTVRKIMPNLQHKENIGLVFNRNIEQKRNYTDVFAVSSMIQHHSLSLKEVNYVAPLYLYPNEQDLDQTRRVNMDPKIRKAIAEAAEHPDHGHPDEVAIFDYIYGVLHCPAYRETYAEFLKIDFPRVPYPSSPERFWDIREKGEALRRLHLMEDAVIGETPYPYVGDGDDIVEKPAFDGEHIGMVHINKTQGFENVPRLAWEFYIGGYQPAQKWLKDRKGRELSLDDILHYRKIIKILSETDRIMKTIEMDLG